MPEIINSIRQKFDSLNRIALFTFTAIILAWGKDFVPPAAGLDPGWREALVQATDQGLGFGTDIIFTFGPYHQIYTNAIGDNLFPFMIGRLIYGLAWGAVTISFASLSTSASGWLLAAFIALSGNLSNDSTFYALQLAFLLIAATSDDKQREWPLIAIIYTGVVISIFCKLSFAVSAGPIIFCTAFLLARESIHTLKQGLLAVAVAIGTPLAIWSASGQSFMGILQYLFGSNISIVLGYSSTMSSDDPTAAWQILAFWIGTISVAALLQRAAYSRLKNRSHAILVTFISLFLFWTTSKAGMVRHDGQHASIAGLSLACFAALIMAYTIKTKPGKTQLLSAAVALFLLGLGISSQYLAIRSQLNGWPKRELKNTYLFANILPSSKARQRLHELRQDEFHNIKKDAEDLSLIPKASSTDSIPWDITDIPANGLRYRPRPIIQSYSAYTEGLQELNRKHFLSKRAPSYLVMNAQSIDLRNPPDLDYPSLEVITSKYQIIGTGSEGSLILKRSDWNDAFIRLPKWRETRLVLLGDEDQGAKPMKERWRLLPQQLAEGSRFSLQLKPNIWRRLQTMAFKASPLMIAIKFDDRHIRTYRVFESTSREIPLYPFVEDNKSLRNSLVALQGSQINKQDIGPMPIAIRLVGAMGAQGLQSGEFIIEQPRFQ